VPVEQQREAIYVRIRALGPSAVTALQRGMADADVQIRRNVALYLSFEGGNYAKHAPEALDLKPFLSQLALALCDDDERVKALSAQALAHVRSGAATAVPDLVRRLEDPSEGLRKQCVHRPGRHRSGRSGRVTRSSAGPQRPERRCAAVRSAGDRENRHQTSDG
jgi:HEAT repeat protein